MTGVALWLLVSFAFKLYLHFFDSYSKTYGTLGAVIVLMLWLYFTGAAILIGGEVNSEIENAAAVDGDPNAKEKGEKATSETIERGRSRRRRDLLQPESKEAANQLMMLREAWKGREGLMQNNRMKRNLIRLFSIGRRLTSAKNSGN